MRAREEPTKVTCSLIEEALAITGLEITVYVIKS